MSGFIDKTDLLDLCLLIPKGTKGRHNSPPTDAVLGLIPLDPCHSGGLHLCVDTPAPSHFGSTHFQVSLWVPIKSLPGDVCCRLSYSVAYPSPFWFLDLCLYWGLPRPSGHLMPIMFLRHLLVNVWSLWVLVLVTRQVSAPYTVVELTSRWCRRSISCYGVRGLLISRSDAGCCRHVCVCSFGI